MVQLQRPHFKHAAKSPLNPLLHGLSRSGRDMRPTRGLDDRHRNRAGRHATKANRTNQGTPTIHTAVIPTDNRLTRIDSGNKA